MTNWAKRVSPIFNKKVKNIFKKPIKGISPQKVKRKNDLIFYIVIALTIFLFLSVFWLRLPIKWVFVVFIFTVAFWIFAQAYLAVKYQMWGRFGSFPILTGPPAAILGKLLFFTGFILLLLMFLALSKL